VLAAADASAPAAAAAAAAAAAVTLAIAAAVPVQGARYCSTTRTATGMATLIYSCSSVSRKHKVAQEFAQAGSGCKAAAGLRAGIVVTTPYV
jgi:hypothetical protein